MTSKIIVTAAVIGIAAILGITATAAIGIGTTVLTKTAFAQGQPAGVPPEVSRCGTFHSAQAGACAQATHPTGPPS